MNSVTWDYPTLFGHWGGWASLQKWPSDFPPVTTQAYMSDDLSERRVGEMTTVMFMDHLRTGEIEREAVFVGVVGRWANPFKYAGIATAGGRDGIKLGGTGSIYFAKIFLRAFNPMPRLRCIAQSGRIHGRCLRVFSIIARRRTLPP